MEGIEAVTDEERALIRTLASSVIALAYRLEYAVYLGVDDIVDELLRFQELIMEVGKP